MFSTPTFAPVREGGAIFARRGMTTIASQTLIIDNTASVEGQTMVVEPAASVAYALPAPPGHWIANPIKVRALPSEPIPSHLLSPPLTTSHLLSPPFTSSRLRSPPPPLRFHYSLPLSAAPTLRTPRALCVPRRVPVQPFGSSLPRLSTTCCLSAALLVFSARPLRWKRSRRRHSAAVLARLATHALRARNREPSAPEGTIAPRVRPLNFNPSGL